MIRMKSRSVQLEVANSISTETLLQAMSLFTYRLGVSCKFSYENDSNFVRISRKILLWNQGLKHSKVRNVPGRLASSGVLTFRTPAIEVGFGNFRSGLPKHNALTD